MVRVTGFEAAQAVWKTAVLPLNTTLALRAASESNAVHRFWRPSGHHGLRPVAPRIGIEPISPLRQRGCDPVASRGGVALSSRLERDRIGLGGRAPSPSARAVG